MTFTPEHVLLNARSPEIKLDCNGFHAVIVEEFLVLTTCAGAIKKNIPDTESFLKNFKVQN